MPIYHEAQGACGMIDASGYYTGNWRDPLRPLAGTVDDASIPRGALYQWYEGPGKPAGAGFFALAFRREGGNAAMLQAFFRDNPEAAIAFSGGVDSAYLLEQASRYAARYAAYFVKSAFQPEFEYADAQALARQLGAPLRVLKLDVLAQAQIVENGPERCYFCKKHLFGAVQRSAAQDGFALLLDGTNASDAADDRPGMRAAQELAVRSPLREAGLEKARIRELARAAGLPCWDKPAYACLATRVPAGEQITQEKLQRVETGETRLAALGYRDFRLRLRGRGALLQVTQAQYAQAAAQLEQLRELLADTFDTVALDAQIRR